jgi:hypothetical protein
VSFKLLTDFNGIHDDRIEGLQRYSEGPRDLRVGDRVLVHDDGNEEALGLVEAVAGELVRVKLDWATFGPAGHLVFGPNGAWWVKTAVAKAGEPVTWRGTAWFSPSRQGWAGQA